MQANVPTATPETALEGTQTKVEASKRAKRSRYKLFNDDGGDYRLYLISEAKGTDGWLVPVPQTPGFDSVRGAQSFIAEHGDRFVNKQVIIFKALHIARVEVESKPQVKVAWKPRTAVTGKGGVIENAKS